MVVDVGGAVGAVVAVDGVALDFGFRVSDWVSVWGYVSRDANRGGEALGSEVLGKGEGIGWEKVDQSHRCRCRFLWFLW